MHRSLSSVEALISAHYPWALDMLVPLGMRG